jgi:hypothetical protein
MAGLGVPLYIEVPDTYDLSLTGGVYANLQWGLQLFDANSLCDLTTEVTINTFNTTLETRAPSEGGLGLQLASFTWLNNCQGNSLILRVRLLRSSECLANGERRLKLHSASSANSSEESGALALLPHCPLTADFALTDPKTGASLASATFGLLLWPNLLPLSPPQRLPSAVCSEAVSLGFGLGDLVIGDSSRSLSGKRRGTTLSISIAGPVEGVFSALAEYSVQQAAGVPCLRVLAPHLRAFTVFGALCAGSGELLGAPVCLGAARIRDATAAQLQSGASGGSFATSFSGPGVWDGTWEHCVQFELPDGALTAAADSISCKNPALVDVHLLLYVITKPAPVDGGSLPLRPLVSAFAYLRLFDAAGRILGSAFYGSGNAQVALTLQSLPAGIVHKPHPAGGLLRLLAPLVLYPGSPPYLPTEATSSSSEPIPLFDPSPPTRSVANDILISSDSAPVHTRPPPPHLLGIEPVTLPAACPVLQTLPLQNSNGDNPSAVNVAVYAVDHVKAAQVHQPYRIPLSRCGNLMCVRVCAGN